MEVPKLVPVDCGGSAPPVYVMQEAIPGLVPPVMVQQPLPGFPPPAPVQWYAEGKEVLYRGEHMADAITPDVAQQFVEALNAMAEQASWALLIAQAR